MWEIFSNGEVPYKGVANIIEYLEKNERLKHPSECEDEIFKWMSSCWEIDPKKR
jgi:hypothetical protein